MKYYKIVEKNFLNLYAKRAFIFWFTLLSKIKISKIKKKILIINYTI